MSAVSRRSATGIVGELVDHDRPALERHRFGDCVARLKRVGGERVSHRPAGRRGLARKPRGGTGRLVDHRDDVPPDRWIVGVGKAVHEHQLDRTLPFGDPITDLARRPPHPATWVAGRLPPARIEGITPIAFSPHSYMSSCGYSWTLNSASTASASRSV